MKTFFEKDIQSVHCVGIKGIGLSALAQILKDRGISVTGSDIAESFPADEALRRAGISLKQGFRASHVPKACDLIIVSPAYLPLAEEGLTLLSSPNIEVRTAARRGIPVMSYPEAVADLFNAAEKGIAVTGTHGKSTTAALLAVTLGELGYNPTAIVGAVVHNWRSNARTARVNGRWEKKNRRKAAQNPNDHRRTTDYFVLEADEYRNAFLNYRPYGAVVTSVDWDHPDSFPTPAAYRAAFRRFVRRIQPGGFLVLCGDDRGALVLKPSPKRRKTLHETAQRNVRTLTYGFGPKNTLRILDYRQTLRGITFRATLRGKALGSFHVALYGRHHALNAAGVIAVCLMLDLDAKPAVIRKALAAFRGTRRRFELLAPPAKSRETSRKTTRKKKASRRYSVTALQPVIIDDYAHHPAEIRATIAAAREAFPKRRIFVLFQPHTYSRTTALFDDFVEAFNGADDVAILKIYRSAREKHGKKSSEDLARALGTRHFATHTAAVQHFRKVLSPQDLLLTLGAGDVYRVGETLARLNRRGRRT